MNEPVYSKADADDDHGRHGRHVWDQLNASVILETSNRTNDPDLESVLAAVRSGSITADAAELIQDRCFTHRDPLDAGPDATALFYTNREVNDVNQLAPHIEARRLGVPVVRLPIQLTVAPAANTGALAADVLQYTTDTDAASYVACGSAKDGLLRYVDVYCGQKLTVQAGNGRVKETGLGNNSPATLVGFAGKQCTFIDVENPDWTTNVTLRGGSTTKVQLPPDPAQITHLLLRVDGPITFRYRGLPPNTIALPRTRPTSRKVPVKFSQFPVRPRKALTVHQSQGTTLAGGVIVDCSWGKRLAYVAISRAVALAQVTLLMPFKRSTVQTQTRPGPAHTRLHTRLTALHSATVAAVDAFAPPFAAPLIL